MKKILLVMLGLIFTTSYPLSYTELRDHFKADLFKRQRNLMSEKAYMKFIEPYLLEGEQVLVIPAEAQKSILADDAEEYFKALLYLNVAILYHYASPTKHNIAMLEMHTSNVFKAIERLATAWDLTVDSGSELKNTVELFTKANKAFYKKLNFVKKGLVMAAAKLASK